jgi:hypothetical protein
MKRQAFMAGAFAMFFMPVCDLRASLLLLRTKGGLTHPTSVGFVDPVWVGHSSFLKAFMKRQAFMT